VALVLSFGRADGDDHWYRGTYGRNRVTHLVLTGSLALVDVSTRFVFDESLAPSTCRWCDPPVFDRDARDALVWDDIKRAAFLSDMSAYVVSPIVAITLLIASEHESSVTQVIDDVLPVVETVVVGQLLAAGAKFGFARERPHQHFGTSTATSSEDNLSFWSAHSTFAFGLSTSAGLIAHWRGYRTEPYVWAAGITLSVTTEYLRIAADRHYLSDVLVGGLVGVGTGLLVPRLMRRDLLIVPKENGAAVVGFF
jgi:membrane-associated phospholipid phosphatase